MTDEPNLPAPRPLPAISAGGNVRAIIPQTFDEAYRIAQAVSASGLAPKDFKTPETCLIAIMHGAEVGLPPMQALQSIAVINGRPSLWGDGALGLVRGSGLLEWIQETIEGAGDNRVAVCTAKRRGEAQPIIRRFSVADAKRANLWTKASTPWITYPERMLAMRARLWVLRDGFADVLRGLQVAEEVMDFDAAPARTAALSPPSPPAAPAPPTTKAQPATETVTDAEVVDDKPKGSDAPTVPPSPGTAQPEKYLKWVDTVLGTATDDDHLAELFSAYVNDDMAKLFPPDAEEVRKLYKKHQARIVAALT